MNALLGSNVINNCDAALYVNGEQVFRLREGSNNGQLICDFDVLDSNGKRIAKIAKNRVVHVADGFTYESIANRSRVVGSEGEIVASVERIDENTIKINGTFHVKGHTITVTDTSLQSSGMTMSGNFISGFGKGISVEPDNFEIGSQ